MILAGQNMEMWGVGSSSRKPMGSLDFYNSFMPWGYESKSDSCGNGNPLFVFCISHLLTHWSQSSVIVIRCIVSVEASLYIDADFIFKKCVRRHTFCPLFSMGDNSGFSVDCAQTTRNRKKPIADQKEMSFEWGVSRNECLWLLGSYESIENSGWFPISWLLLFP